MARCDFNGISPFLGVPIHTAYLLLALISNIKGPSNISLKEGGHVRQFCLLLIGLSLATTAFAAAPVNNLNNVARFQIEVKSGQTLIYKTNKLSTDWLSLETGPSGPKLRLDEVIQDELRSLLKKMVLGTNHVTTKLTLYYDVRDEDMPDIRKEVAMDYAIDAKGLNIMLEKALPPGENAYSQLPGICAKYL
jgi:hypothetical protein